jgi:hypothetical protein
MLLMEVRKSHEDCPAIKRGSPHLGVFSVTFNCYLGMGEKAMRLLIGVVGVLRLGASRELDSVG